MPKFNTLKEYQADIKKRYPFGVPFQTARERYYTFETITRDYGLTKEDNNRPIRTAPRRVLPARNLPQPIKPVEIVKGVDL